jgi:hypothetical protein
MAANPRSSRAPVHTGFIRTELHSFHAGIGGRRQRWQSSRVLQYHPILWQGRNHRGSDAPADTRAQRHYKAKFASFWEPCYDVLRSLLDLPRLGMALSKVAEIENREIIEWIRQPSN